MKIILLLFLCTGIALSQSTVDRIDSVRIITLTSDGVYPRKVVEVYCAGKWRYMHEMMPIASIVGLQTQIDAKLNTSDYVPGGGTPIESFFEKDSQGNIRPKATLTTDTFFELDANGYIRPKQ
jgi:hypothetical protein